jgi:6-aminohexanoate-oligomer exohydrolase
MVHTAPPVPILPAGATLANWLESPYNQWSLHHVENLVGTTQIPKGRRSVRVFGAARQHLGRFAPELDLSAGADGLHHIEDFCAASYTDAMIVLQGERIVFERYFGGNTSSTRHIVMSVSKSICGMLAGLLAAEGAIDLQADTATYLPELAQGPYGTATVAELLDMTAALDFNMDHADAASEVNAGDRCAGWRPRLEGDPADTRAFLQRLRPAGRRHGEAFQYCSATTEVLARVLERASGLPYARLLAERLWSRIGAERDAYVTVDNSGAAYACAGIGMTLRDLARFGRIVLDDGWYQGEQVIPAAWIGETRRGGNPEKVGEHEFASIYPKGSYHNQWWITGDDHGSFYAAGLFGQYLWLDPLEDVVIAKFSSAPVDAAHRMQHAEALRRIAETAHQPEERPSAPS